MKYLFVALIKGYQFFISPYFPTSCRYYPTCSHYAIDAVKMHGAIKGTGLALWRILRCNPYSNGGEDPVPGSTTHCSCEDESPGTSKASHAPISSQRRPSASSTCAHSLNEL